MGRTIIVGDVHGCREELDSLLDRLVFTTGDTLVFVGDLVARGPDSRGVLDIVRRTGAIAVRGNHEDKLLAYDPGRTGAGAPQPPLGKMHQVVADSLREADWALLRAMPLWCDLDGHGARVLHAGVVPNVPIAEQEPRTLLRVRSVGSRGEAIEGKSSRAPLWGAVYAGPPHIVFGHNALSTVQFHPWATGIDTGCVYGGSLTAVVLEQGEPIPRGRSVQGRLVSEAARRVHFDWKKSKE